MVIPDLPGFITWFVWDPVLLGPFHFPLSAFACHLHALAIFGFISSEHLTT